MSDARWPETVWVDVTSDVRALPDAPLAGPGPLTARARAAGFAGLRDVAAHVRDLPYGRVDALSDVLVAGRGTCSTKHALLAALGSELGLDLDLRLCLVWLDGRRYPAAAPVLASAGLEALPEAHCVLAWGGRRVDLTSPHTPQRLALVAEQPIAPDALASKAAWHRGWLARWAEANPPWTLDDLWAVREACIAALSTEEEP